MKVGIVWNRTDVETPVGVRIVVDPRCRMFLDWTERCGRPATIRVTNPGCWSAFFCETHAEGFSTYRRSRTGYFG